LLLSWLSRFRLILIVIWRLLSIKILVWRWATRSIGRATTASR